jgi:lipopolysaccharide export LptBFGC system permease protein LptF
MFARLDRSLLREIIPVTIIGVLGLTFLFTTVGLFQIVNRFEVTPRVGTLLAFLPALWQLLLPMTLPVSLTFAASLSLGRMRAEGEILVLQSAGVAPWRAFLVLLPLGLLAGAFSFYFASELGPSAYARRDSLTRQAVADFVNHPPAGARELRLTSLDLSYADVRQGRFESVTLILHNDQGLIASMTAQSARISYDRQSRELVLNDLRQPRVICFDPKSGAPGSPRIEMFGTGGKLLSPAISASHIENLRWKFEPGGEKAAEGPKALDTLALLERIATDRNAHAQKHEAAGELVRRVNLGLAGLLLPLLGALLAALVSHPNRLLAVSAGVIPGALAYFPLMTAASGLARNGLDVWLCCAPAPLVLSAACAFVLSRHQRGRWL